LNGAKSRADERQASADVLIQLRTAERQEFHKVLTRAVLEPIGSAPEQLGIFMRRELVKRGKVLKAAKIQLD
jgi:hypothetical protein